MKTIEVVAAIIEHDDRILCTKRGEGGPVEFLWEFPGGKIEEGESHKSALIREIDEELSMNLLPGEHFLTVQHGYPEFKVILHSYMCHVESSEYTLNSHLDAVWLPLKELNTLDWAYPDQPIVEMLMSESD